MQNWLLVAQPFLGKGDFADSGERKNEISDDSHINCL